MLATTVALVVADLAVEIAGAALLGWALLFLLPFIGGLVGGLPVGVLQWLVLRRHLHDGGAWILFTVVGFFGAWTLAMIIAAVAFVPRTGLDTLRTFLSIVVPTPIIGLAQSAVLRRSSRDRWLWVLASTVGWGTFVAVEIFRPHALMSIDELSGRLVSAIAGYAVSSGVGATLLGGACAGGITGVALAALTNVPEAQPQR